MTRAAPRDRTMSTFLVLDTPVTSAPNDLAICTANVPTPPAAPLIKIFCAGSMCPLSRRPWSDGLAILYFRLGERTKALQALEQAYKERQLHMTEIGIEPAFDELRSEPRFQELLRQVGVV